MNKVFLSGRLTADAELRFTPNGVAVATFTLAAPKRFKREGEPDADFINCVVWQKPAENTANMIGKGCRVNVVGRWNTRNYEGQDGKKVYVNECVVEEINFIDYKDNGQANQGQQGGQQQRQNNQGNANTSGSSQNGSSGQNWRSNGGNYGEPPPIDISDDDLPF